MKHILLSIFILCSLVSKANPIQGLLERIDKGAGDKFETELVNSKKDFFELSQDTIVRYKIIRYKKFMPPDKPLYQ